MHPFVAVSPSTWLGVCTALAVPPAVFCAVWAWLGYRRRAAENDTRVPVWAKGLSPDAFDDFISLVRRDLTARGHAFALGGGSVIVQSAGRSHTFALADLLPAYDAAPAGRKAAAIAAAIDAAVVNADALAEQESAPPEAAAITDKLLPQLGPPSDSLAACGIVRQDLPGVQTCLVLDYPAGARAITADESTAWGSPDDLFTIALANLRRQPPSEPTTIELEPGLNAKLFFGESPYVAAGVLLLAELPDCLGRHGALVAVPTQNMLLCHPIENRDALRTLVPMAWVARRRFSDGPASVSPRLFWREPGAQGRLVEIPSDLRGPVLRVTPPGKLVERLGGGSL